MRYQVLIIVALAVLPLEARTAAAWLRLTPVCKPVKDKVITVPENPQFLLEHREADNLRAEAGGKELVTRVTRFDARYSNVVVEAAHGMRFTLGGTLHDCEFKKNTYRVATDAPPPDAIKVVDIDFMTASVELHPSSEGWFEVALAGSEEDMQQGRVLRYVEHLDGDREMTWIGGKRGVTTDSRLGGSHALFENREAPYFMRITPLGYDGNRGLPFEAWVGPKTWANSRAALGPEPCSPQEEPPVVVAPPGDVLAARTSNTVRGKYPYAMDRKGRFLGVTASQGRHPRAQNADEVDLYTVDAQDGANYEFGFYPRVVSTCPKGTAHFSNEATAVRVRKGESLRSPLQIRGQAPTVAYGWRGLQNLFSYEVQANVGPWIDVDWSKDGVTFVEYEELHTIFPKKRTRNGTAIVRVTPKWEAGDGPPWFAWARITEGPKPYGAKTPKYYISEWGLGVVPGKQRMERRRFDWPE